MRLTFAVAASLTCFVGGCLPLGSDPAPDPPTPDPCDEVWTDRTLGLLRRCQPGEEFGYTLFAPMFHTTTWLIDGFGDVVHSWPSSRGPGLSVYLLPSGNLLRAGTDIQEVGWDGEVTSLRQRWLAFEADGVPPDVTARDGQYVIERRMAETDR